MPMPASKSGLARLCLRGTLVLALAGAPVPITVAAEADAPSGAQEYRAPVNKETRGAEAAPPAAVNHDGTPPPAGQQPLTDTGGLLPTAPQPLLPPDLPQKEDARTQGTADLLGENFSDRGLVRQWRDPQTGDSITQVVPPHQAQQQNPNLLFIAPQIYPDVPYKPGGAQGGYGGGSSSGFPPGYGRYGQSGAP